MRTFFSATFITLALLVGAAGAVPAAHAQWEQATASGDATSIAAQANTDAANAGKIKTDAKPSTDEPYNIVMRKILELFAWLVGVAALLLDYAVYFTVVKMGSYVNSLSAIGVTWRVLRDIGNIMLIFGFLAVGISTILNTEFYGWKTKMLPMMLVAAVFLNFSLFISEAIVDTGNLFATQFYTQINGGDPAGLKEFDPGFSIRVSNEGISNKIMNQLGLATIYGDGKVNLQVFEGANPWLIGFMGVILFIVTAFVLFSLAFILIARFVALIFLLVVAPIGFAGLAIPGFAARAKQWWDALLHQTIVAPILLLMLYIALRVITDVNFLSGFTQNPQGGTFAWTGFVGNTNLPGFAGALLSFLVAIGLLLGVIVYAKRWSAFGGDWASRMGARLSFGAASFGMRATLGSAGNLLASKRMQSWARKGGAGGLALKGVVLAGKGLRSSTYDVRNTGALKNIPLVGSNVDFGTGATITAKQAHDADYGVKPIKEWLRDSAKERDKAAADLNRKDILATGAPAALQTELKRMSDDELAELKGIRQGQDRLIQALRPTAYDSLMKNKNLLDSEKTAIRTSWENQFNTHVSSAAALGRMTEDERVALGGKVLSRPEVYQNLTADDFDNIRSAKLQPAEKTIIAGYVRAQHAAGMVPGAAPTPLQRDLVAAAANPKFKAYYGL